MKPHGRTALASHLRSLVANSWNVIPGQSSINNVCALARQADDFLERARKCSLHIGFTDEDLIYLHAAEAIYLEALPGLSQMMVLIEQGQAQSRLAARLLEPLKAFAETIEPSENLEQCRRRVEEGAAWHQQWVTLISGALDSTLNGLAEIQKLKQR